MAVSQNGYSANDVSKTKIYTVGNGRQVRLRSDDCGWLLADMADWFDANVEDIDAGQLDDWGYAERPIRGSTTVLSNHASGTAIDLNATKHPLGVRGTFTSRQAALIRSRLRVYDGCIRWGGDFQNRADEMHWEINKPYTDVHAAAEKLRARVVPPNVQAILDDKTRTALYVNHLRFMQAFPRSGVYDDEMRAFKKALDRASPQEFRLGDDPVWGAGTDSMVRWVQRHRLGDEPDKPGDAYLGPIQLKQMTDPRRHRNFARHVRYGGRGGLDKARAWLKANGKTEPGWMKGIR